MEPTRYIGVSVNEVKCSLDDLQSTLFKDKYSQDSLLRLRQALKDINEEVNMLRTAMQIGMNKK